MANEMTVLQEVQGTLAKMGDQFKMALPKHISTDKFIRAAQTSVQNYPDLLQCSRPSLYNACMKCAQDGLIPDGREAVITKRKEEAVYMPMIGGILKLIRNSGELATVDAEVVHEKDEYDCWTDEKGPHFRFKRAKGDRGPVVSTFAYAITKDGGVYFEDVSNEEMAAIQKSATTQFVWNGAFREEMMKKSALRRMSKRMPKSTDIEEVFKNDDENFDLGKAPEQEPAKATTSSKLSEAVAGKGRPEATDAEVVPTQADISRPAAPAPKAPAPAGKGPEPVKTPTGIEIKGILFEEVSTKDGETNGKRWIKYGGKASGKWYGTFDKKFYDLMVYSKANRALMNVKYLERAVGDKVFYEILEVEQSCIDDVDCGAGPDDGKLPY